MNDVVNNRSTLSSVQESFKDNKELLNLFKNKLTDRLTAILDNEEYFESEDEFLPVFDLIQHGADINAKNSAGLTVLMVAAKRASLYLLHIEGLIEKGVDLALCDSEGKTGLSYLLRMVNLEDEGLKQAINKNLTDALNRLDWADTNNLDQIFWLITNGADTKIRPEHECIALNEKLNRYMISKHPITHTPGISFFSSEKTKNSVDRLREKVGDDCLIIDFDEDGQLHLHFENETSAGTFYMKFQDALQKQDDHIHFRLDESHQKEVFEELGLHNDNIHGSFSERLKHDAELHQASIRFARSGFKKGIF